MNAPADADHAAGILLRELARGREPHPILRAVLIDALQETPIDASATQLETLDNAGASAAWLTATPAERGAVLDDLLSLADQFPSDRVHRMGRERFPRLDRAP